MAYITPNTTIYLLRGVPLDSNYTNTFYFNDLAEQTSYMQSFLKPSSSTASYTGSYMLTGFTYQRINKNTIRVQIPEESLFDINYMMFQNTNYGTKWFYAFVLSTTYINDVTTEIEYQIDVMQSWFFDYELGACFVERQHSETDVIGDNIVPENLELGEYICHKREHIDMSDMRVGILSSINPVTEKAEGVQRQGVFSGLYFKGGFALSGTQDISVNMKWSGTSSPNYPTFDDYDTTQFEIDTSPWSASSYVNFRSKNSATGTADYFISKVEYLGSDTTAEKYFRFKIIASANSTSLRLKVVATDFRTAVEKTSDTEYVVYSKYSVANFVECNITYYDINFAEFTSNPNVNAINQYIESFPNGGEEIVNIFEYPAEFENGTQIEQSSRTLNFAQSPTLSNGYTPKNKKIYTAPYDILVCCDNCGNNVTFCWEDCDNITASGTKALYAILSGTYCNMPTMFLYPRNYRKIWYDYESGIASMKFPTCSWTTDVYKSWWNQNKTSFITGTITGALQSATSIAGGAITAVGGASSKKPLTAARGITSAIGGGIGVASGIANSIAKISDMKAIPPSAQGQMQCEALNVSLKRVGYTFYWMSPKEEILQTIDGYFTMFGYASKQVKVPNIHARTHWTYVKTIGCNLHAKKNAQSTITNCVPAGIEDELASLFDKGLTFWSKHGTETSIEVGDYSRDNNCLATAYPINWNVGMPANAPNHILANGNIDFQLIDEDGAYPASLSANGATITYNPTLGSGVLSNPTDDVYVYITT